MNREDMIKRIRGLTEGWASAVRMTGGENPLAPNTPTRGVLSVGTWASSTRGCTWRDGTTPEGWDVLVAREENGDSLDYIVVWAGDKGYCLDRSEGAEEGVFTPLHPAPSMEDIADLVDGIREEFGMDDPDDEGW
jgi:hypothetical protein